MRKRLLYKKYTKKWKKEHQEGSPACYDEWLNNEFAEIKLEDNEKPTGGISYQGETLAEFLEEIGMSVYNSLREINRALHICGIKKIS